MIKNIVFDIGKVLIGFDWDGYMASMFDEDTARKVTEAMFGGPWWKELDRAVMSESEIIERFCGIHPEVRDEILEAYDRVGECVARREWVIPLVESLREKGYKVYFLSNMSEHVAGSDPEAYDFIDHMDGGIFSWQVHVIKPDPEFYRLLLDEYDLVPEECLFIDDSDENLAAARRLGLKGLRFDGPEQLAADIDKALVKDISHDKITILCYGDSNTYGYDPRTGGRYPVGMRWTTILGEKLGDRYEVINEGLNGRTTAYDRPGAIWKNGLTSFISCMGTHKPVDYIVIMLGTNDCNAALGHSAEDIAAGMEELVKAAEEASHGLQGYMPEVIVTAPAAIRYDYYDSPFAAELSPESVKKSRDIAPLYRDVAARHHCRFLDATETAEVSAIDSEHLSERGHEQLADMLYELIAK